MVKEKRVEVNAFSIMSNHIHLILQIQDGYLREDIQRDYLKFTSQTIRDLRKNHPKVLEKFYVGAKDRKYPGLTGRAGNMGAQSFKCRFMDKGSVYTKAGVRSLQLAYRQAGAIAACLCTYPEEYKYSSAKFYETGVDEFGFLTHWVT